MGFVVWGLRCRVQSAGCRVWIAGCMQGAGCRVQGAGCRVQGAGCRGQGAGCTASGAFGTLLLAATCARGVLVTEALGDKPHIGVVGVTLHKSRLF